MQPAEQDLMVLAMQNGNQKAFAVLYRHYHQALVGFAHKLAGDAELANDAVQDAWIKLSKNIRQLKDPRAFKSFIYRLVRWRVVDLLKVQSRRQDVNARLQQRSRQEAQHQVQQPVQDKAAHNPVQHSISEDLAQAINALPETERHMIHLFYLDELKISEISTVLGIPSGTVKSRLNRARNLLKQKFS